MTPYSSIIAAVLHGVNPDEIEFHKASAKALSDYHDPNYGALEKLAASFAVNMYRETGQTASTEYFLFEGLTKVASWLPEYDKFTDPVFASIAGSYGEALDCMKEQASLNKSAGIASMLTSLVSGAARATPAMVKTLMTAGAATGAGMGALYWGLNRHSTEDEEQLEAQKERLRHYTRITREISDDLRRNNVTEPEEAKKTIQQDAGTPFVTA